jgi:DNA-3-methyladenine glycosylase II
LTVLRIPQPYDFALSTERFRAWGRDLANLSEDGALYRAVGGVEVRLAPARGGVDVEPGGSEAERTAAKVLGLEFELEPFRDFAGGDPVLARIVTALEGFRPPLSPDPWEMLVTSITAQQVSLHAAFAIRNRLIERYGVAAGRVYAFPSAERVAAAEPADLLALGFSARKAEYVVGLARAPLDWDAIALAPDDEVKVRITSVRGLGEWTADWYLARHLARPRAWPAGDLGLRKALAHFYGIEAADARAAGARFAPFENLAAHHLLTALRVAP